MKLKNIFLFLISSFLMSCENNSSPQQNTSTNQEQTIPFEKITTLNFSKKLIPEGIAVNGKNQKLFYSSLNFKKITQSDLQGKNTSDFITFQQYNYKAGLGMEMFDEELFAIGSNDISPNEPNSILLVLDPQNGSLINSYEWKDTTDHFFNDIAISSQGKVYITNSHGNSIFTLDYPNGKIEKLITSDDFVYGNGIAISDDDKFLFVATWEKGIRIIDLATKKIINGHSELSRGMDGLKFYNKELYAMYNGNPDFLKHELVKFRFNDLGNKIIGKETVVRATSEFHIPTTFDIHDDIVYFIANSQLDFFEDDGTLKNQENLQPYLLFKHILKE